MTQASLQSFWPTAPSLGGADEPAERVSARLPYAQVLRSPLRYPGAKRQLIPFFVDLLAAQERRVATLVEPFAGGASVGLHLAATGMVDRLVLGELDELLYAFWHTAAFDNRWLVGAVQEVPVTLERWDRYRADPGRSRRDRALACLFLNRTSFSGILHTRAGPIGGRSQSGPNRIDVRFPRETLARRLRQVGELGGEGRIAAVRRSGYRATTRWALARYGAENALVYLDPPFYAKAQTLYRRSFASGDHGRLANYLERAPFRWLLSYDHHPAVVDLYRSRYARLPGEPPSPPDRASSYGDPRLRLIDLRYSAHSSRRGSEELLVTNLAVAPGGYLRTTRS